MRRAVKMVAGSTVVSLGVVAGALAATPVKNGVYEDGARGVIVALHATNSIHALNVECHGKKWVALRFIPVAHGAFSYSGPDFLVRNGRKTSTTGTMTASGRFKTSKVIVGRVAAGGCSGRYTATFSYATH